MTSIPRKTAPDIQVHPSEPLETAVNSYAPSERSSLEDGRSEAGVNVLSAEKHFAQLQRQLSEVSQASRKLSRTQSRAKSIKNGVQDIEKAVPSSESSEDAEPFNLEDTLRGNKQLEDEAGIKSKQIGVVWENLTVKGVGGTKITVPTFPDAFTNFFLFPFRQVMRLLPTNKKGKEGEHSAELSRCGQTLGRWSSYLGGLAAAVRPS